MGDNRIDSKDSRYSEVGFIDIADIVARAGLKFWPINGFGILK
jgi:signal peptidase I